MFFKLKRKIGSLLIATAMVTSMFAGLPVMAANNIEVILTDVTSSDTSTKIGDAKIQVSIKGNVDDVSAVQAAFDVSGDLDYTMVTYLVEADAPADAKVGNKLSVGFALDDAISLVDETAVFILTFEGDVGESVTVSVDNEHSYCYTSNGSSVYATGTSSISARAAENAKEGLEATVKVKMDKVPDFVASNESGVTLKITDQSNGNVTKTTLNASNRDSGSKAEFTVTNTVIKGNKYTVEISGIGYKTYKVTDISFDEIFVITNENFIPGDINKDGNITDEDKEAYDEIIASEGYNPAADFNRDGYVDEKDNVFSLSDSGNGENDNNGDNDDNTGNAGGNSGSDDSGSGNNTGGGGSSAGGGTGSGGGSSSGGGSGSGGGGSSGGGTSSGGAGGNTTPTTPSTGTPSVTPSITTEIFTDLGNYDWAKDSIYALKNKGIISGVSETEFAPANNIKRGDFILILTRMLSIDNAFDDNFADVPTSSYYYNAIGSAKVAGIAHGNGENFMPENTITRQDLITLAYRAFLTKGYITETDDMISLDSFADKDAIADYALAPMASMVKAGIIQGSDGNVNPLGNATRAEVAVMCARLVALMN